MKEKLIVCRHAESLEDVDKTVYDHIPDLQIPLTPKGRDQAHLLGVGLCQMLQPFRKTTFFTSPGKRNQETLEIVLQVLPKELSYALFVDPLIVKQDWGPITTFNRPLIEEARYRTGVLRYAFPGGESAADLIWRLKKFVWTRIRVLQQGTGHDLVIVAHGFEFRVLLMLLLGWEENYFESLANVNNCEHRILTREESGTYTLHQPLRQHGSPVTRTGCTT